MSYLVKAIHKVRPGSQFSFVDDDYATIKWDLLEGDEPTESEINAAIEQVKADEAQAKLDRAAKKAAAEAKLEALGLTPEDLKALGL